MNLLCSVQMDGSRSFIRMVVSHLYPDSDFANLISDLPALRVMEIVADQLVKCGIVCLRLSSPHNTSWVVYE